MFIKNIFSKKSFKAHAGKSTDTSTGPLRLALNGQVLFFRTPVDLAHSLKSREEPSSPYICRHASSTKAELLAEMARLEEQRSRFAGLLHDCQRGLHSWTEHLSARAIHEENDWRAVFHALLMRPAAELPYLKCAVASYMAYLLRSEMALRLIQRLKGADETSAKSRTPDLTRALNLDAIKPGELSETLRRLPQGEPVLIRVAQGCEVSLKIAQHQVSLSHRSGWSLSTAHGERFGLSAGPNVVGRSRENQVVLDGRWTEVSRRHLVAEPLTENLIALTDLSSQGTFIEPSALAS